MISGAWKWIKDNKWKTFGAAAVIGGFFWYKSTQSQQTEEKVQKQRMTTYWRDSQVAADKTIAQFVNILSKHVEQHTRLFEIVAALRNPENTTQDRARLFKELKVAVFAAHLLFLYSTAFIANYLRISVNVVGRHLFSLTQTSEGPTGIDLIRAMLPASGVPGLLNGSPADPERKFEEPGLLELTPQIRDKLLSSSEHFLLNGLPILADIVTQACIGTMENHPLEEQLNADEIVDVFLHIRNVVEGQFWRSYEGRPGTLLQILLLPPEIVTPYSFTEPEDAVFSSGLDNADKIRLLMNEQRNVIESVAFQSLFQHSLNVGFAALSETISKSMPKPNPQAAANSESNEAAQEVKQIPQHLVRFALAKLLPALTNHYKSITVPTDNLLVERITGSNDFNEFSYRVFHGPQR